MVGLSTIEPTRHDLCTPRAPPEEAAKAPRRTNETEETADRLVFAGTKSARGPQDAAARDGEIQSVDRYGPAAADPSVLLAEPLDLDDGVHPRDTVRGHTHRRQGRTHH